MIRISLNLPLYIFITVLLSLQTPIASAAPEDAQTLIIDRSNALISALAEHHESIKSDKRIAYQLVEEIILPHIDFTRIARLILGKYWRRASQEQQQRFITEFRGFLVRTYVTAMVEFSDQIISHANSIKYLPFRNNATDDVSVRVQINLANRPPININYSLFQDDPEKDWMIYDLTVEGISLATTYRGSFSTQIRRIGIDALINKLAARNAKANAALAAANNTPTE